MREVGNADRQEVGRGRLPLVAERMHEAAPRVAQGHHEQMDPNPLVAQIRNPHTRRAYARAATEFFDWLEGKGSAA